MRYVFSDMVKSRGNLNGRDVIYEVENASGPYTVFYVNPIEKKDIEPLFGTDVTGTIVEMYDSFIWCTEEMKRWIKRRIKNDSKEN
jgi:hypothetical protein